MSKPTYQELVQNLDIHLLAYLECVKAGMGVSESWQAYQESLIAVEQHPECPNSIGEVEPVQIWD